MDQNRPPVVSKDPITGQDIEISFVERSEPGHEGARQLLDYWRACRARGDFVMGSEVPAAAIARFMKNLIVLAPDNTSFRLRLVGNVLNERLGRDVSDMLVSEIYAEPAARAFEAALNETIVTDAPVFRTVRVRGLLDDVRRPEVILLPMRSPDRAASWVLAGVFYH